MRGLDPRIHLQLDNEIPGTSPDMTLGVSGQNANSEYAKETVKSFDYIIIGAGSAGCVLANRLSEDPDVSVCLLEAGPPARAPWLQLPISVMYAMSRPKVTWQFQSTPQESMNGRQIHMPRGKTFGGSSAINGMLYLRGQPADYDGWEALGNPGWGWREVLPYFKISENNEQFGGSELHGEGGPLNVRRLDTPNPLNAIYQEAAASLQYPMNEDFNGDTQEGAGVYQATMTKGRRMNVARAFLDPVRSRKNLHIMSEATVTRINLDDGRAVGVTISQSGPDETISATREVILSAGSLLSPVILMKSGIGDPEVLKKAGIPLLHALPGVGKNLQDHPASTLYARSKSRLAYGLSLPAMPRLAWWIVDYLVRRKGLFASNIMEGGGFYKTDPALERPDIQHILMPAYRQPPPNMLAYGHGYSLNTILLRPKSRGKIGLSRDGAPEIDLNMMGEEEDLETLLKALKQSRRLLNSPAFEVLEPEEFRPGPDVESDEELRAYIRTNAQTIYHPVGTCKMGPASDGTAVVDDRLRLYGIEGLRVVDGSIMPTLTSGNTNAPIIMIAEKTADKIKTC